MSAKSIIYQALTNDTGVTNLVPVNNINQQWFNRDIGVPQITIFRVSEVGAWHGNDGMTNRSTPMQIDIWVGTDISPTPIETEVKRVLNTIGTNPLVVAEGNELDEPIYRITIQTNIEEVI